MRPARGPALPVRAFTSARRVLGFVRRDHASPFPLGQQVAAWRKGFLAESAALYDFSRNDPREYVSDTMRMRDCQRIHRAPAYLEHKLVLRAFLLARGFAQAETFAIAADGRVQLHPFSAAPRYVSAAELTRLMVADGGRFIIKPDGGSWGRGIYLIETREGRLIRSRGTASAPFELPTGRAVTLIERRVEQGAFWRELHPGSTNSIRALTMWTPGEDAPFVARAVQRMGTADTAPTDNWSGGGICAPIDPDTGRLGLGRMHPLKGRRGAQAFTRHPDSGARIEGATVPHWDRVQDTVVRAAASLPFLRYVGWDVFVDDSGTPIIGEGNNNSDVNLLQVHGGLLADPRVRRFYERVGAL